MNFVAGGISSTMDMDNRPHIRAVDGAVAAVKKGKMEMESAMGAAGENSGKAFLKGLGTEFGKKSLSAQFLKVAMGGGAIAGVNMGAHVIEDMTGKLAELADARRKGEIAGDAMGAEILREIPIFGKLVSAVDNVREAMTGEGVALDKQVAQWKGDNDRLQAGLEYRKKIMQEGTQAAVDWAVAVGKLDEKLAVLRAGPGQEGKVKVDQSAEDMIADARKRYEGAANLTQKGGADFLQQHVGTERYGNDVGELIRVQAEAARLRDVKENAGRQYDAALQKQKEMWAHAQSNPDAKDATISDAEFQKQVQRAEHLGNIFKRSENAFNAENLKIAPLQGVASNAELRFADERKKVMEIAAGDARDAQKKYWDEEFKHREEAHKEDTKAAEDDLAARNKAYDAEKQLLTERAAAGKSMAESLMTPLEKMEKTVADLKDLRRTGDITDETLQRGIDRAQSEYGGRRIMQLPNPGVHVQEMLGAHRVTVADLPAPYVEMMNAQKTTAESVQRAEKFQERTAVAAEKLVSVGNRSDDLVLEMV